MTQQPVDHLGASLPQMVRQARDTLVELVSKVDPAAADWLEQMRGQKPSTPSVVVVGETKGGKSSLVNALLENPGLSPVDACLATSAYLVFQHGSQWCARAQCWGQQGEIAVDVEKLGDWVMAGPPEGQPSPRSVQVDAPLELLTELTLVDTPGVGGLDSLHGELAREAAASATALLFVVDASAPLTRSELDFLCAVSDHVETVVFAMTKIDRHRGWRKVLECNRRLLAEHAPRFADAPIHPVSARLQSLVTEAPAEQAREVLRQQAGIAELRTKLTHLVAGRSAMLCEANTMRALSTVLSGLVVKLEAEERMLTAGEEEGESLRARRTELSAARRSSTRGWQVVLRAEIQRCRVEMNHEVTRQMREVQNQFRRAVDTAGRKRLPELPHEVDAALRLVSARVASRLSAKLAKVAELALAELFSAEELAVIRGQLARGEDAPVTLRQPEKRSSRAEDKLLVFMGVSGGLGMGRSAVLPLAGFGAAAVNPVVWPVAIVLGLGAGWWLARTRQHSADKQHLKQWLTEVIADLRSTVDQLVAEQLITAEQQLSLALDDALAKRLDSIDGELREVDKALKMDAEQRSRRLRSVQDRLADARAGKDKAEHLLESIRVLRDSAD